MRPHRGIDRRVPRGRFSIRDTSFGPTREPRDLATIGGIVTKGLYLKARDGCEVPRIAETPAGLLNAIGLQGVGIGAFVETVLPQLRAHDTAVIVNVCGETVEEYAEVSRIASEAEGVHALEINISCPNVKTGGIAFGTDPVMAHEVVSAVRRASHLPVIPKLSPNVTDITVFARACEEAGGARGEDSDHRHRRDRFRE